MKLEEVCEIRSGGTPKRSVLEYWQDGTIPWVKISDMKGKYVCSTEECITESGMSNSSAKLFEKGTILYSIFASIGEVGILKIPAATNQAIAGFRVKDEYKGSVDRDYLYHWLRSRKALSKHSGRGAAQNNINLSILKSMELELPAIGDQRCIAAQFERVARLEEGVCNQLAALDDLRKSRFIEMFGDPCNSQCSTMSCCSIKQFCEVRIGPFGSALHKSDYVLGGHALVNPSHIVNGKIKVDKKLTVNEEKYASMKAYHLKEGDVVLGRRGEIGRCAVVDQEGLLCGTGSMILRPDANLCLGEYLQRVVSFPTFAEALERDAVGVTMKNLNAKIVEKAVVVLPSMSLQREFISFVHQVDKLEFRCAGTPGEGDNAVR